MKECVYGWYPPAREVLKTHGVLLPTNSYAKNHAGLVKGSTVNDRWRTTTPQNRKYRSLSRALSRTSPPPDRSKSAVINLEIRGEGQSYSRPSTASSIKTHNTFSSRPTPDEDLFKVAPPSGSRLGSAYRRPVRAWQTETKPTNHIPDFQDYLREVAQQQQQVLIPHPTPPVTPQLTPDSHVRYLGRPPSCTGTGHIQNVTVRPPSTATNKRERIKSATTSRPKLHSQRSIKSAGSIRCTPGSHIDTEHGQLEEEQTREEGRGLDELCDVMSRDDILNGDADKEDEDRKSSVEIVDVEEELGVDNPLDYEQQLEKYGWRMQVHGDPLNLKRPCIAKRLPYTEKLAIPVIPPDPPKARSECYDTFFLNTIPHRPMTFTIDKDWASEVLHAKRMELQKRDGDTYKYRTANFSFVY